MTNQPTNANVGASTGAPKLQEMTSRTSTVVARFWRQTADPLCHELRRCGGPGRRFRGQASL